MKSLTDQINESILNEAKKCVVNAIPDCPEDGEEYEVRPAIDACYGYAEMLEDSHINMGLLKKVKAFKGYDQYKLHDYAYCLEEVGAWINGLMACAEDEVSEAYIYVDMVKNVGEDYEQCVENSAQNIDPAGFDSIHDDEDIYDYFNDIFANWNDVSKAIFKMPWS